MGIALCFNDSSQSAYGSVVYLKFSHLDETKTAFVISKSRVAPLKKLSLPRLELMAALLGARLIASIREHFAKFNMWTDSKIVIHWIKNNPRRWKTLVQNRVAEIQEKTPPEVYTHVHKLRIMKFRQRKRQKQNKFDLFVKSIY
ncbi:hypothetical protein AVEN_206441-1 [Araneus ventricosus]|uniref:RNase H type-1 domain-containing protein n=1 Tax=Araneus ventricosus TaxID=182803 RepID=A0A4Y2SYF3_ARAVE|nr:hypothetical protein AVEN_206441-1 [Araneus ventricosus]